MGCGCKKKSNVENVIEGIIDTTKPKNIIIKLFLFVLSSILIVVLYPLIVILLFKHFVIGGSIDIGDIVNKIKNKVDKEEDNINIDSLDPNDYELLSVDEIKISK